uniref:Putative ribonuclease H-like domain-containing protein n=1 Tax=Tanacetum cinerariifolium TaxID=118510 RepID=A0A699GQU7_TANCI|nr:putative ribonuclease H-like domain-containing protein [Tanacetum cinerariifolium]
MDQPIRQVLLKPENSRRISKWAIELGEHEILYKPRSAIKGKIITDFLVESPMINDLQDENAISTPGKSTFTWTLFTDDASSIEGSGVGLSDKTRARNSDGSSMFGSIHGLVIDSKPSERLIISDNGKQFANNPFREWCEELEIKQKFTSVAHPQANRQTKVVNRVMSSPNHPTSDIEEAFSSTNTPDYTPASPDYLPASPGNTSSDSLNNSSGLVPIASLTLLLFHDDPYMKVKQAYYAKELPIPTPIISLTIVPPSPMLSTMFNPQEFFLPEELLPPKKRGHERSSSSTSVVPQAFEIG